MYEEIFSGGENGPELKVTTKLLLVERLGKNCDETLLPHMALLGVQVELHLTFTATAVSTHAPNSFSNTVH